MAGGIRLRAPAFRRREIAQHVHFARGRLGVQLDARNDFHAEPHARIQRLGHAVHRIVIGQRDGAQTARVRLPHDRGRRQRSVRRRRVDVQIDAHGAMSAFLCQDLLELPDVLGLQRLVGFGVNAVQIAQHAHEQCARVEIGL